MTKTLKPILLDIASLKRRDQQWILQQLSNESARKFTQKKGLQLLATARRFLGIKIPDSLPKTSISSLPSYCQTLANKAPLYIAIILKQGDYPWTDDFLKQLDDSKAVSMALDSTILDIKPAVQTLVWQEWQQTLSFEHHLENDHG